MKTMKSIVLCLVVFTQTLKSQKNNHKYYLEGQLTGGFQEQNFSAGAGGAFGFFISKTNSVDLRAREIYNFNNHTMISSINVHYRYHFTCGVFVGGGFAHQHELSQKTYFEHPAEASLGSHPEIKHRSGFGLEVGYNFKALSKEGFFSRIYPVLNISYSQMIMDKARNPLITGGAGLRIGLQKF